MVRAAAIAILAVAFAQAAVAQTTNCTTFGNTTNCQTNDFSTYAPPPPQIVQPNYQLLFALAARRAEQRREEAAEAAQQEASDEAANRERAKADIKQRVAMLLQAGKCDDAKALALDAGEIDLAKDAAVYCANSAPPRQ